MCAHHQVSLPQIEFPSAEVLYYLPERERWVILIEGGQEAAARGDQLTVLAPAGADVAASSEKSSTSSGCCKGNSASKPAQVPLIMPPSNDTTRHPRTQPLPSGARHRGSYRVLICFLRQSAPLRRAQGCCKDTVEQAGNDEAGARTACGDAGDNASCGVTSADVCTALPITPHHGTLLRDDEDEDDDGDMFMVIMVTWLW